ncbi:beta strand repeat-containing protein, partial [Bradyrhizobium japonicum]
SSFQPLQVNISGAVTGSAVGDLSLLAVTGDLMVGSSGTYGTLTAGGALTLNAARGALTVNADITSGGLVQLIANRGMNFAAGTGAAPVVATSSSDGVTLVAATLTMGVYSAINAAGLISVTTTGDATIGQLNSSLSYAAASNAPSIIVTAGGIASLGAIIDNGDGQTKFVASGAGAELSLSGSNGIGSATSRIAFSAVQLSASASAGGIYLKALTDTEASLLSAVKGNVDIIGTGALTLDQVLAGTATGASGSFGAVTNNGSIVIGTADSSGSQTVHASQNVTFKSLATAGNSGDAGNIGVTADNGFILAQTVSSGGATTLGSVSAHGSATLLAATTITGNTLATTTGSGLLTATGPIDWNTLNVGTTLGATASQGSINFKTAQSGATQTIRAHDNVTFNALTTTGITGDAGSINVTADNGFILAQTVTSGGVTTLGSVSANGSATLLAATTITGNTLAATTGSGLLTASGPVNWNVLNVGTTLGVTSGQGSITLQTAQSGGTQTIHARDNVTFNALTATGINGDAGSINVNADNGFILAQTVMAGGVPTLGSVSANGSARLIAAGTNTGHNLTATTGNAVLSGTVVRWDNLNVGGTLDVTATAGGITVGTAISGGTQTLHAVNDIVFSQLTTTGIPGDAGDIDLRSDVGAIRGGSISANGNTRFSSVGPLSLDRISGDVVKLSSTGDLTIRSITATKGVNLAAATINVNIEQIGSTPPIPLVVNVTGSDGGAATSANISIDAPSVIFNQFKVVDANVLTNAQAVAVLNGYVPGQMMLTTATQQVLLNNRTLAPSSWPTLQLYQPGGVFTMSQIGNANVSNAYVVFYTDGVSATVTNYGPGHTCCYDFTGASMVRNIAIDGEGKETIETWLAKKDGGTFYLLGLSGQARLDALLTPRPVETIGSGPAVNIEGLNDLRKLRRQGQRLGRPGWKDAAVETAKPSVGRLAQAW